MVDRMSLFSGKLYRILTLITGYFFRKPESSATLPETSADGPYTGKDILDIENYDPFLGNTGFLSPWSMASADGFGKVPSFRERVWM